MSFRNIDRVGVEIEGGWPVGSVPPDAQNDGSLRFDDSSVAAKEMRSKPFKTLRELEAWVRSIYPPHTNSTCGTHVHFSFNTLNDYSRLADERFYQHFIEHITTWARGPRGNISSIPFYERLEGRNHHCMKKWDAEAQIEQSGKGSPRYAHWNFCFKLHGTAECRLLPTFKDVNVAVRSIKELIDIVDDYLDNSPVIIQFHHKSTEDGDTDSETIVEEV